MQCAQAPTKDSIAEADKAKQTAQDPPPQKAATSDKPVAGPSPAPDIISYDAGGREDLRKRYGLSIVEAESAPLAETPNNSFGFAYGGSFATVWKDALTTLTIRSTSRSVHFEMQKRGAGLVYIIGYMRGDTAKEMQNSLSYPEKIRLYSDRYKKTDAIVAIPIQAIKSVGQSTIDISGNNYIPVLDLGFR